MKKIRTKLTLAILLLTILPVFPLYYLIKNFFETTINVGLNHQVERALEQAADLSQRLLFEYKKELLQIATDLASDRTARPALMAGGAAVQPFESRAAKVDSCEVFLTDTAGRVRVHTIPAAPSARPRLGAEEMAQLLASTGSGAVTSGSKPELIAASVPVRHRGRTVGSVIVAKRVDDRFVAASHDVVEANQMFKTFSMVREDVQSAFILSFFIVYVPIALAALAAGYFFARKITAPLNALALGTEKVAAGDWDFRLAIRSQDELGTLVDSFNAMIGKVKEKQEQVVRLEKMAAWREMARALAHEIKNPLTPIQLTVQQIKDTYAGDDDNYRNVLNECTEIINDEIQNLQKLVREFSAFARMPELQLAPGNLNEIVEETRRLYADLDVRLELAQPLPQVLVDFEKMRRVFLNFFENSRYSLQEKGGGWVRIQTRAADGRVHLIFADTGNGMPPEVQANIFEPYFSTKRSGMGLGLPIVRRIVEEHGGTISVQSREGEGTSFHIELPVC